MTVDELIDALQAYTQESTTTLPDATCAEFVNTAIRRLQRVHPYQGEATSADLTITTAGQTPLPADFIAETGVWLKDTSQTDPAQALSPIVRTSRQAWVNAVDPDASRDTVYPNVAAPGDASPTQRGYYVQNGLLVIVPSPTSTITVQLDYTRLLADLVVNQAGSNHFTQRYPDVVRAGALAEAYRYRHEDERAMLWEQQFLAMAKESISQDEAPSMAGNKRTRGL